MAEMTSEELVRCVEAQLPGHRVVLRDESEPRPEPPPPADTIMKLDTRALRQLYQARRGTSEPVVDTIVQAEPLRALYQEKATADAVDDRPTVPGGGAFIRVQAKKASGGEAPTKIVAVDGWGRVFAEQG